MKYKNKILKIKVVKFSKAITNEIDDTLICEVTARWWGKVYNVIASYRRDRQIKDLTQYNVIASNPYVVENDPYVAIKAAIIKKFNETMKPQLPKPIDELCNDYLGWLQGDLDIAAHKWLDINSEERIIDDIQDFVKEKKYDHRIADDIYKHVMK